jgi:hypothetical protein
MLGRASRKHATLIKRVGRGPARTPSARLASSSAQASASTLDPINNELPDYNSNPLFTFPSSSKITLDNPPIERFDWRLRARRPAPPMLEVQGAQRTKKVRRVAPPEKDLQPGEEYFDEVNAYRDRYV